MTTLQELDQFNRFAESKLREAQDGLSLEKCLLLWRRQIEDDETVASIQRGIADCEAGRVKSLDEAFDNVRRQLGASR